MYVFIMKGCQPDIQKKMLSYNRSGAAHVNSNYSCIFTFLNDCVICILVALMEILRCMLDSLITLKLIYYHVFARTILLRLLPMNCR